MDSGSIKPTIVVVIRMIPMRVPVSHLVGIQRLVGVVGMADPLRYWDRCDIHLRCRLVGVALGVLIGKQMRPNSAVFLA